MPERTEKDDQIDLLKKDNQKLVQELTEYKGVINKSKQERQSMRAEMESFQRQKADFENAQKA